MPDNPCPADVLSRALRLPWLVTLSAALLLAGCAIVGYTHGAELQAAAKLPEAQLISLRTALYWVAILTLPLTNVIRHVQLRLNQTMPTPTHAKNRYCLTVLVSTLLCLTVGGYGLLLFYLGDGYNTLVIFNLIAVLGLFLYRPRRQEYQSVVTALNTLTFRE